MNGILFTQRIKNIPKRFVAWYKAWMSDPIHLLGVGMLLIALVVAILGYINQHAKVYIESFGERREWFVDTPFVTDFYANFSMELASIAITILIVDRLYRRRDEEREKKDLILQMGSPNNVFAREAIRRLRKQGWLFDSTMEGADLGRANLEMADLDKVSLVKVKLEGANLKGANLTGADLREANLRGVNLKGANLSDALLEEADLSESSLKKANMSSTNLKNAFLSEINLKGAEGSTDEQLAETWTLRGATMVSGKRYNGRFNLEGDLLQATHFVVKTTDSKAMAIFFDVSEENYEWGQEWYQFWQSPPLMYSPDLPRWHELNNNPEGK